MKPRVAAYAAYQLRDYLLGWRAILSVGATVGAAVAYARWVGLTPSMFDPAAGVDARARLEQGFAFTLAAFAIIAAIIGAQGLVARDRSRGYSRVLFSRPITPLRYYLQGYAVAGATAVVLAAVAAEVYAATLHPVSVGGVAGYVALSWIAIGGPAFLLSVVTRFHTLVLTGAVGVALALTRYVPLAGGVPAGLVRVVEAVLPPIRALVDLRDEFVHGAVATSHLVVWAVGYGFVSLTIAAILLVRRPLTR